MQLCKLTRYEMPHPNQIRAAFDAETITIYQAYSAPIARPALAAQKFVPPFSLQRMTWIKPSFLWLMERSNWGQKSGQENILAVAIRRDGWDEALGLGVLTSYEAGVHRNPQVWRAQFEAAPVHVQWDPERSLRGKDVGANSIQVGLGRAVIERYVEEWVVEIRDLTPLARKIHALVQSGQADRARKLLPPERLYSVENQVAARLAMKL